MDFPLLLLGIAAGAALLLPSPPEIDKEEASNKQQHVAKRMLVIPFHRLQFVEHKRPMAWWQTSNPNVYQVNE